MSFRRSQAPPQSVAQARIASANRWGSASQSTQPDQDGHATPAAPVLVVGGSGSSGGDEHRGAQLPPGQGAGIAIVGGQVRPSWGHCRVVSHVCLVEIRMHRPGCLAPGWDALARSLPCRGLPWQRQQRWRPTHMRRVFLERVWAITWRGRWPVCPSAGRPAQAPIPSAPGNVPCSTGGDRRAAAGPQAVQAPRPGCPVAQAGQGAGPAPSGVQP